MNIDIVLVTFNRIEKLKTALASYDIQGDLFRNLIVVNNCSSDGTNEYLEDWKNVNSSYSKIVINTRENVGGSGGFFLGQTKALELGADWVYVADDDAYADKNMLAKFYEFVASQDVDSISVVCSSVLNPDGTICLYHRQWWNLKQNKYLEFISSTTDNYLNGPFKIELTTYVGSFIKAEAMRMVGTVNPNYFIYYDDYEHCFRLRKVGDIICVPSMMVVHDSAPSQKCNVVSWADYYLIRNLRHMIIKHLPKRISLRYNLAFILKLGNNIDANKEYMHVYKKAIWHAMIGRMGIYKSYHPGCWQRNLMK